MPFQSQIEKIVERVEQQAVARRAASVRQAKLAVNASVAGGLFALILALSLTALIVHSIVAPLRQVEQGMTAIPRGDLDAPIPLETRDEIGAMVEAVQVFKTALIAKQLGDETLQEQNRDLQKRKTELQVQNLRFDAALNNMIHGFCMFDRAGKLVISNRRYAEMYGLAPDDLQPGITLDQILGFCAEEPIERVFLEDIARRGLGRFSGLERDERVDVELDSAHHPRAEQEVR